jgi:hypothetical protein
MQIFLCDFRISETTMNNETGLAILSAVLNGMSYPNRILTNEEDNSTAIDVKDLHKILLTGCYYPPEQGNKKDTPTAGIENCTGKFKIVL